MKNIILWISLILVGTFAQLLLKIGLLKAPIVNWSGITAMIKFYFRNMNLYFISGLILTMVSFLLWVKILSTSKVSTAFNISSLMYIAMALEAYFILGEPIGLKFIIGTILIMAGVVLCI